MRTLLKYYKTQILISVTLGIVILAINVIRLPWEIAQVVIGVLLGTFIIDTEYLIYTYYLEPQTNFSQTLRAYIKHRDFNNAISFINLHKEDFPEKSLQSILFQLVIGPMAIFAVFAAPSLFVKALIVCIFANSIYRLTEDYISNKYLDWFWALNNKPTKSGVLIYILVLTTALIYALYLFK